MFKLSLSVQFSQQPLRNRSSAADSDRQMDWLRPNIQTSRLSLSVEHMTEPELEKLKQRAMSQADVMSEGKRKFAL